MDVNDDLESRYMKILYTGQYSPLPYAYICRRFRINKKNYPRFAAMSLYITD